MKPRKPRGHCVSCDEQSTLTPKPKPSVLWVCSNCGDVTRCTYQDDERRRWGYMAVGDALNYLEGEPRDVSSESSTARSLHRQRSVSQSNKRFE
jgi:predicted RNA-binding Zn-ribbon protein involved in translation (DUF1610 family)